MIVLADTFRWVPRLPKETPTYIVVGFLVLIALGLLIGRNR